MTTLGEARAELINALTDAGIRASADPSSDTPFAYVTGDGTGDPSRVMTGRLTAAFRVVLCGGAWDQAASAAELDLLKQVFLSTVLGLEGWRFSGPIGRDGGREWAGGLLLTADAFCERLIDL